MTPRGQPTVAEQMAARGMTRRVLLQFGACMASLLGLGTEAGPAMAEGLASARRQSLIWLSFQECTGCTESLTRAHSPTLEELIFDFVSLDYHHTLQAASGAAAEAARLASMKENAGKYLLIVDGSVSTRDDGVYSTIAGVTNLQMLEETARDAFAIIALGSCAAFGGLPYAHPNPTGAAPVSALIQGKPLVNVSGCPPIPTVITGVLAHVLAFGKLPELDHLGRPLAFFGETIHDRCYRRPFYDQGLFASSFDDEGARKGYCLYEVGCKGPIAYNACATQKWNGGTSFPIQSGHGCFGCSEPSFWDREGGLYGPLPSGQLGGSKAALVAAGVGLGLGAASAGLGRQRQRAAEADVARPRSDEEA